MEKMGFKYSWGKFYWDAWLNDINLQSCDLAAQGLWINLIAIMHKSDQIGYLVINGRPMNVADIAKRVGIRKDRAERLLQKLIDNDVCSVTDEGILYCRRIVREQKKRNQHNSGNEFDLDYKKNDNQFENKKKYSGYRKKNQGEQNVINFSSLYKNIKKEIQNIDILTDMETIKENIKSKNENFYYASGSRLPSDWYPDTQCRRFAFDLNLCPDTMAEDFRDFWHAKHGKEAIKMDWSAAWRRWCRIANQWLKTTSVQSDEKKNLSYF
ncbi:unnamed protein product [Commensalibacter communis]|uniref:hypothetical protein n=1 Tax=Commensalibacter communis TaxID=2972786 RepID=UPI0022FF535E|nr:hypothetical protein [Commensalibacter communis]CAI3955761.1 unnamed protein product [Commensalibacter communis]CAI3956529.1 unnamed protein product [Commensalibacter communis]